MLRISQCKLGDRVLLYLDEKGKTIDPEDDPDKIDPKRTMVGTLFAVSKAGSVNNYYLIGWKSGEKKPIDAEERKTKGITLSYLSNQEEYVCYVRYSKNLILAGKETSVSSCNSSEESLLPLDWRIWRDSSLSVGECVCGINRSDCNYHR